jgi:hypothetical protein
MVAAGVAVGFTGWFVALIAGHGLRSGRDGVSVFLVLLSLALWIISYAMVSP